MAHLCQHPPCSVCLGQPSIQAQQINELAALRAERDQLLSLRKASEMARQAEKAECDRLRKRLDEAEALLRQGRRETEGGVMWQTDADAFLASPPSAPAPVAPEAPVSNSFLAGVWEAIAKLRADVDALTDDWNERSMKPTVMDKIVGRIERLEERPVAIEHPAQPAPQWHVFVKGRHPELCYLKMGDNRICGLTAANLIHVSAREEGR